MINKDENNTYRWIYEQPMLKALEYVEARGKVTQDLSMSTLFLPVMKDKMADKEKTLENITAAWDKLETESGQKEVFEINNYEGSRTAMLNTWYVYFALTGDPLSPEALDKLKENADYDKGELLVYAYK